MNKRKIADEWLNKHGAADLDLKHRDIILNDGGLFSVSKEIKYLPRHRLKEIKEGPHKGYSEFVHIKGKKVKYEFYSAIFWFEELHETILYLQSMERMLQSLGYNTNGKYSEELINKLKELSKEAKNEKRNGTIKTK